MSVLHTLGTRKSFARAVHLHRLAITSSFFSPLILDMQYRLEYRHLHDIFTSNISQIDLADSSKTVNTNVFVQIN